MTGQLQMEHQALLKAARERLRGCQESQAFGDTLQGVWAWLEEIQERLGTVDSTMGTKEQLEQRLETVQVLDILDFSLHINFAACVVYLFYKAQLLQRTQEGAVGLINFFILNSGV